MTTPGSSRPTPEYGAPNLPVHGRRTPTQWEDVSTLDTPDDMTELRPLPDDCPDCECCSARLCTTARNRVGLVLRGITGAPASHGPGLYRGFSCSWLNRDPAAHATVTGCPCTAARPVKVAAIPSVVPAPASGPEVVDGWEALGVSHRPDDGHVSVLHDRQVIGIIRVSQEFPEAVEYCAVLDLKGHPWPVPFPAGFIPDDPIRAYEGERRRWLPSQDTNEHQADGEGTESGWLHLPDEPHRMPGCGHPADNCNC